MDGPSIRSGCFALQALDAVDPYVCARGHRAHLLQHALAVFLGRMLMQFMGSRRVISTFLLGICKCGRLLAALQPDPRFRRQYLRFGCERCSFGHYLGGSLFRPHQEVRLFGCCPSNLRCWVWAWCFWTTCSCAPAATQAGTSDTSVAQPTAFGWAIPCAPLVAFPGRSLRTLLGPTHLLQLLQTWAAYARGEGRHRPAQALPV